MVEWGGAGDEIKAGLQPASAELGGKRKLHTSGSDISATLRSQRVNSADNPPAWGVKNTQ